MDVVYALVNVMLEILKTKSGPPYSFNTAATTANQHMSRETQHVKVVDARNYESPEDMRPGEITVEFTKLMGQTPVGDKYVFQSPHSATLSCEMKTKRAKRRERNRANRRLMSHSNEKSKIFS